MNRIVKTIQGDITRSFFVGCPVEEALLYLIKEKGLAKEGDYSLTTPEGKEFKAGDFLGKEPILFFHDLGIAV